MLTYVLTVIDQATRLPVESVTIGTASEAIAAIPVLLDSIRAASGSRFTRERSTCSL